MVLDGRKDKIVKVWPVKMRFLEERKMTEAAKSFMEKKMKWGNRRGAFYLSGCGGEAKVKIKRDYLFY